MTGPSLAAADLVPDPVAPDSQGPPLGRACRPLPVRFLVVVDNTIVNVALPTLNRNLGASITSLQWIVDAYSLAFAGLLLAGGGIGDRLGRKGTMQVGLVFFGLFSAAAAVVALDGHTDHGPSAHGRGSRLHLPGQPRHPHERLPRPVGAPEGARHLGGDVRHRRGLRTRSSAGRSSSTSGTGRSSSSTCRSWSSRSSPVSVLIPRLPEVAQHRFDVRGVFISTLGVTSLVLAIIEGPQWGWASVGTLACFAVAAVLLTAFTLLELRTEGPLLDVRVFKIPRFSGGALSISVAFFCLFGFIFLITQYFQFVKGYSTLSAGVHTLPFAIVAAIFTPAGGGGCAQGRDPPRRQRPGCSSWVAGCVGDGVQLGIGPPRSSDRSSSRWSCWPSACPPSRRPRRRR